MAQTLAAHGNEGSNIEGAVDRDAWRNMVARARSLMIEQETLGEDLKALCAECHERGIASRSELRRHARMSLKDQDALERRRERDDMLQAALGDFASLPLGTAAIEHAQKAKRGRGRPRRSKPHEVPKSTESYWDYSGAEPTHFDPLRDPNTAP